MNRSTALIIGLAIAVGMSLAAPASAQPYTLDWYTIDCGGGTSAGGGFELSGTIGQQDAGGALTGGSYEVVGGYWTMSGEAGPCSIADFTVPFGVLDFFDVQAFLAAFAAMSPSADLNDDDLFDFFDVQVFLQAFSAGCP